MWGLRQWGPPPQNILEPGLIPVGRRGCPGFRKAMIPGRCPTAPWPCVLMPLLMRRTVGLKPTIFRVREGGCQVRPSPPDSILGPSWGPAPCGERRKSCPQRGFRSQLAACCLGHDHQLGQLSLEGPRPVEHCKGRDPGSVLASASPLGPELGGRVGATMWAGQWRGLQVDSIKKGSWP